MKIICIGRNYSEHAKELNNDVPTEPVIFMKPRTALVLKDKPVFYPEFTNELHYECEVVVRINKNGKFIQEKFAPKYYNEITVGIDFTARDLQQKLKQKGLPWEIAKAFDGSAVVGDFIPLSSSMDIQDLGFQLNRNGCLTQEGNTKDMIFSVNKIIAYISQFFTLNTGDLIFTGTPAGVGPVSVNDSLQGYLQGKQLFNVDIK
jgi:acylpyruvate hydrolase